MTASLKFSDLPIGSRFRFHSYGCICTKTKADSYSFEGGSSKPTRCVESPVILEITDNEDEVNPLHSSRL